MNRSRRRWSSVLIVTAVAVSLHQTASAQTAARQVTVTPSTDLQDGQTVLVQGTGWRPYSLVTIEMCKPGVEVVTQLFFNCDWNPDSNDQSRRIFVPTGHGGDFQAYFPVRKTIHLRDTNHAPFTTHPYTCDPTCSVQVIQWHDEGGFTRGHPVTFAPENPIATALRNIVNSTCGAAPGPFCDAVRAIIDALLPTIQPPPPPPPTTTTTIPPVTVPRSTVNTAPPPTLAPVASIPGGEQGRTAIGG